MKNNLIIHPIGRIKAANDKCLIELHGDFKTGLKNIDGFTHLQVIWWGHLFDSMKNRKNMITDQPYKHGPEELGVFATRSPVRPNPILITTVYVQSIDFTKGIIYTPFIDAENDTPVLDIKPYHKSERINACQVPEWCAHWPEWYEDAAYFDWAGEFNF